MIEQKVLALHGWGGTGTDSTTVNRVRAHFEAKGCEVVTPTYDYLNPDKAAETILASVNEDDYIFIVGVSFGGFWARWLGNRMKGASILLLNPALDAYTSTEKYLGKSKDYATGVTALYAQVQRQKLKKYHIDHDRPDLPITAIVATDDDVVAPDTVEKEIGSSRCDIQYITGGHRLEDPSQWIDRMEFAYNTISF